MPVVEGDPTTSRSRLSLPPQADLVPTGLIPLFCRVIRPVFFAMIQAVPPLHRPIHSDSDTDEWQIAMKRAIRSQRELRRRLGLPEAPDADAAERFPTFVPLEMLARIRPGDANDPILRQVLADERETDQQPGFTADPVGDLDASVAGGLIHKYHGRALLVTHGACAVHCRYCFRREFPYSETGSRRENWKPALESIRSDGTIEEVLLSGGDPLTLTDASLDRLVTSLEEIAHVRRLRLHTRLPIAIPQRITENLVARLTESRLVTWVVIHCNHAQEIDSAVTRATDRMINAGLPVLNQSVLLAGVNDHADTLVELSKALVDRRIQPYYLHQLDRVQGSAHFLVPEQRGHELVEEMRRRLPGYAVPQYVAEHAGAANKTPLG
ncbi:MAG: EF-P beta-lysylation protein EpmB [Planctomycetota bacterium]